MLRLLIALAVALLTLLVPNLIHAAPHGITYYVATNGSDANPGTLAAPWRTIQKAADTLAPGDTAYVRAGVYNARVKINVSGSALGGFVTFASYPGETAIVDGKGLKVRAED